MPEWLATLNSTKRLQMIGRLLGNVASEAPHWPLYTQQLSWWTAEWGPWALGVKLAS